MDEMRLTFLRHYGKLSEAAKLLGVEPATITSWMDNSPRNMLKHLPEISKHTGLTYNEIVGLVQARESEILNIEV